MRHHECTVQEWCQGTPPSERGGRGHEWDVHAWQKTSNRGRDGGSTAGCRRNNLNLSPATSGSNLLRVDHVQACIDSTPQYSPHRPFHSLPRHNTRAFPAIGRHPPLGGGRMLAHFPFCACYPTLPPPSSPATIVLAIDNRTTNVKHGGWCRPLSQRMGMLLSMATTIKSLKNLFSILTWPYLFLNRSNPAVPHLRKTPHFRPARADLPR